MGEGRRRRGRHAGLKGRRERVEPDVDRCEFISRLI